ncbi:MAG: cytochrome c5 family protein [Gammaproteobacteria bacterium]|nr:cytochrome c5 family protein [Gammaproteobacteria bacterium]
MSGKQDESFFRGIYFMMSALVILAIAIVFIASEIYRDHAVSQQTEAEIAERIRPIGEVNVSGEKISAAATSSAAPTTTDAGERTVPVADAAPGEAEYRKICFTCHEQGIAGAPKTGDPAAWAERAPKGVEALLHSVIEGVSGPNGVMLPRGGMASLTDAELEAAVRYMLSRLPDQGGI